MKFRPPAKKKHHHRHHHRHHIVARFAGVYLINQKGEYVVMSQSVPASTVLTVPLIFTQDGNTIKGPVGEVLSSDPSVSPSLSADGQAVNFTSPASGSFQLKWHMLDASVAPCTLDIDVAVVVVPPPIPIIASFGTVVPGTTP